MSSLLFVVRACHQKRHDKIWQRGYFFCPGCNNVHAVNIDISRPLNQTYCDYNQNAQAPSLSAPVRIDSSGRDPKSLAMRIRICDSQITDGFITYSEDTTHEFTGKRLALSPVPDWLQPSYEASQIQDNQGVS